MSALRRSLVLVAISAAVFGADVLARQAALIDSIDYQPNPAWPGPLPNGWKLGSVTGIAVDRQDNVWVVHRANATPPAAPVLKFDPDGRLVASWGGPGRGFDWPSSPGGIAIDVDGGVWITAACQPEQLSSDRSIADPPPVSDTHVLKFSPSGFFLRQVGKAGEPGDATSQTRLNCPAAVAVDSSRRELVVADGGTSQRVVYFDLTTGEYRRHEIVDAITVSRTKTLAERGMVAGALRPFARLSSVVVSVDSRVYAGDRKNNSIVVFSPRGNTFGFVAPDTKGLGSVWGMALSRDPMNGTLFVADGEHDQIHLLESRSLRVQSTFGRHGGEPGAFQHVGPIAVDSRGNVFTGEMYEGRRVQKFTPTQVKR